MARRHFPHAMMYPYFDMYELQRETEEFMNHIDRLMDAIQPPAPTCEVLDDPNAQPDQPESQPTDQPTGQGKKGEGATGGDVDMSSSAEPSTSAGNAAVSSEKAATSADSLAASSDNAATSQDSSATSTENVATSPVTANVSADNVPTSPESMVTSPTPEIPTSEMEILIVPGPSSNSQAGADPTSSGTSTSTRPLGASSPKRKADDSQQEPQGAMETDSDSGQPAAKEAKLAEPEVERREDVEQLVSVLSGHLGRSISPTRAERYRLMDRQTVRNLLDELRYRDMYFARHALRRRGDRRDRRREEMSDEDSDSESPRPIYSDPTMGGAKFVLSDEQQLLRLLIIGSPIQAKARNVDNDPFKNPDYHNGVIVRMLDAGQGMQVVEILRDVSVKGRSPRQDGLIYALARCCRHSDIPTKRAAYAAIKDICRTPTQLFQLIHYIETLDEKTTGWGRGLRRAVCDWYNSNSNNPQRLAMHVTKYWNRHGWCHRDVFRLAHIKPANEAIGFIVRYAVKGMQEAEKFYLEDGDLGQDKLAQVHKYLKAVEEAKQCLEVPRTLELIKEYDLVREQLRTEMLNQPDIWSAMLPGMPLTALLRNLNKMTSLQLFDDPERMNVVREKLLNMEAMKKARVHPFKLLLAHHVYKQGHGERGSLTWQPHPQIVEILEKAFYQSFKLVEPTNKRILIALDISGSMTQKFQDTPIECREAATLMAMVTVKTEPNCDIVGFHNKLIELNMFKTENKTLQDLVYETHMLGFGSTDCSKPMTWARHKQREYDAFIIYTDSETNSHRTPPWYALKKYREKMNLPNAKLIVVGISGYNFTIAQPGDINMLDVVGFDTETPDIIREFLLGSLE